MVWLRFHFGISYELDEATEREVAPLRSIF